MARSIMEARLVMLPFAVVLWLIAWCGKFVPVTVKTKKRAARALIGLSFGIASVATMFTQLALFRSMTRMRPDRDPFFFSLFLIEAVVTAFLYVRSNDALRRKGLDGGGPPGK